MIYIKTPWEVQKFRVNNQLKLQYYKTTIITGCKSYLHKNKQRIWTISIDITHLHNTVTSLIAIIYVTHYVSTVVDFQIHFTVLGTAAEYNLRPLPKVAAPSLFYMHEYVFKIIESGRVDARVLRNNRSTYVSSLQQNDVRTRRTKYICSFVLFFFHNIAST